MPNMRYYSFCRFRFSSLALAATLGTRLPYIINNLTVLPHSLMVLTRSSTIFRAPKFAFKRYCLKQPEYKFLPDCLRFASIKFYYCCKGFVFIYLLIMITLNTHQNWKSLLCCYVCAMLVNVVYVPMC